MSASSTELERHMTLLSLSTSKSNKPSELKTTPIFTSNVRRHAAALMGQTGDVFTQYGLLAGRSSENDAKPTDCDFDPRLFYNIAAPSSVFICGSQGSGKSHTLACLLENCLVPSEVNVLPRPLTGVVFHYDTFNSDTGGLPCEAAHLSTSSSVKVRVLCSPTNIRQIREIYSTLPHVTAEPLLIDESHLNTARMIALMALDAEQGDGWPLYIHTVLRILRIMRAEQQFQSQTHFDYSDFKRRLGDEGLVGSQLGPLQQRLDTLESFMPRDQVNVNPWSNKKSKKKYLSEGQPSPTRDMWTPRAGELTIVDLSCPCITAATACSLFKVCLELFLEQDPQIGRVVALDEAHKYMTGSAESETLTESLLSAIRLQRHLAARIFISTQEPTISPKLLDLCSVTLVHRFTSPEWLMSLRQHLAGASPLAVETNCSKCVADDDAGELPVASRRRGDGLLAELFAKIVDLHTGEALLFAPSATIGVRMEQICEDESASSESGNSESEANSGGLASETETSTSEGGEQVRPTAAIRLGNGILKVGIRLRVTGDGGRSKMAE